MTTASIDYQIIDDNNGTAPTQTDRATLTFNYQNGAPTATSGGDPNPLPAGQAADYQFKAQDPDGDQLTYFIDSATFTDGAGQTASADSLFHLIDAHLGTFHFDGGPAGTWTVTFHVTDGPHQSGPATFTITTF